LKKEKAYHRHVGGREKRLSLLSGKIVRLNEGKKGEKEGGKNRSSINARRNLIGRKEKRRRQSPYSSERSS